MASCGYGARTWVVEHRRGCGVTHEIMNKSVATRKDRINPLSGLTIKANVLIYARLLIILFGMEIVCNRMQFDMSSLYLSDSLHSIRI